MLFYFKTIYEDSHGADHFILQSQIKYSWKGTEFKIEAYQLCLYNKVQFMVAK